MNKSVVEDKSNFLTILSTQPIYVKNTRIEILVGFTRRRARI